MSSGLNCDFIEMQPDAWYLLLEDRDAPREVPDWREFASMYGPFTAKDEAIGFLDSYFSNPGGWRAIPYDPQLSADPLLVRLMAEAPARRDFVTSTRRAIVRTPPAHARGPLPVVYMTPDEVSEKYGTSPVDSESL